MDEFKPEYPGDNVNRAWVRDQMRKKGQHIDFTSVILHMSAPHIKWMFDQIVGAEWPMWKAAQD